MRKAGMNLGLAREYVRSVRRLNGVRLAAVASFFALFAALGGVLRLPAWQGNLAAFSAYLLLAAGVYWGARRSRFLERAAFLALALVDAPMVMVLQLGTYPATPDPAAVAGYSIGFFVVLLVLASLSLRRQIIFATGLSGALCEIYLQYVAHVSAGAMLATPLVLGVAAVGADYGRGRVRELLGEVHQRAAELAVALRERDAAQAARLRLQKLAAIGQLSATIGHDLRNPLGVVRTATFVIFRRLRRHELSNDPTLIETMLMAERELDRCEKIITDLLDFARERQLDRRPTPLAPLVDEALSVIRKQPGVRLVNRVPADLPPLLLDPGPFRQVLVNLIQNGADALQDRDGRVEVGAEVAGERARVWIRDDGKGIAPEAMEHLFEPLFTTKAGGTGLGLAIVASLVRQHSREIAVESRPGEGAAFELRLPLVSGGGSLSAAQPR